MWWRGVYRVWVGKPEGKRPIGRPWRRGEDNIKMDLQEVACGGTDWIELAQVAGTCECGNEPSGFIKCGEFDCLSSFSRTLLHAVSK